MPKIINDRPILTLLRPVIFNDMTELSVTILEQILSDKNYVAQNSKSVYGEHKKILEKNNWNLT